jgi:hypothetical protein
MPRQGVAVATVLDCTVLLPRQRERAWRGSHARATGPFLACVVWCAGSCNLRSACYSNGNAATLCHRPAFSFLVPSCRCARAWLRLTCLLEGRAPCCTKFSSAFGLRGICTSAGAACLRPSSPVGSSFLRCAAAHAFRARVHGHITRSPSRPVRRVSAGPSLPILATSTLATHPHSSSHHFMTCNSRTSEWVSVPGPSATNAAGTAQLGRVSVACSFGMAAHGPAHQHDADSDRRREDAAARVQAVPPAPADVPGVPRRMGSVSFSGRSAAHRTPSSHPAAARPAFLCAFRAVCVWEAVRVAGEVGYLTIDESVVEEGASQRRGGLHTESPGGLGTAGIVGATAQKLSERGNFRTRSTRLKNAN